MQEGGLCMALRMDSDGRNALRVLAEPPI